jgi:Na+-transporting NADH:ubiquinone oxidoreductase subunit A
MTFSFRQTILLFQSSDRTEIAMPLFKLKQGLDLPITGRPEQTIHPSRPVRHVALIGADYVELKPSMLVAEGDTVQLGQPLFEDKKRPGVFYVAPGSGVVKAIHRGARRVLQSVVIALDEKEAPPFRIFEARSPEALLRLDRDSVVKTLLESGLWTALRTRPFSKIPDPQSQPAHIFVSAMDTHPLAANPAPLIEAESEAFQHGLRALSRLTQGKVWVCHAPDTKPPVPQGVSTIDAAQFEGPHPAGLPGTHIHCVSPVHAHKTVWSVNYQDVMAIGHLFLSGQIWTERIVALGGPVVDKPRLIRTRLGASLEELTNGELKYGENRVISGSVFGGRTAKGPNAYLGRYHLQVSCLKEGTDREFLHYLRAGHEKHSVMNLYLSKLSPGKLFDFTTTTQGSPRAMVPIGNYEEVMPLDILPTQLLRSLIVGDTEMAQKLGALELDEEDLALCTYVCAGKYEYGPILRENLSRIEKEG